MIDDHKLATVSRTLRRHVPQQLLVLVGLTLLLGWSRVTGLVDFVGWSPLVALVDPPRVVTFGFLLLVFALLFITAIQRRWRSDSTTIGLLATLLGYTLFFDLILLGVFSCETGAGQTGTRLLANVPVWVTDRLILEYKFLAPGVEIVYGSCSTWINGYKVMAGWIFVPMDALLDR